jgi:predicted RNA-binding Zn-ribbon protein involved in translation (DUF1610 family)
MSKYHPPVTRTTRVLPVKQDKKIIIDALRPLRFKERLKILIGYNLKVCVRILTQHKPGVIDPKIAVYVVSELGGPEAPEHKETFESEPPSFYVRATQHYRKWCTITICEKCGRRAHRDDQHPVSPCPTCGAQVHESVGRWVDKRWITEAETL